MAKTTMNVSLTPELERHIQSYVERGLYGNQSEVVRAAVRMMIERDQDREAKLAALRKDIEQGLEDVQAGRGGPLDLDAIKARGRARLGQ